VVEDPVRILNTKSGSLFKKFKILNKVQRLMLKSWACSECGMASSRKSSVVRHIHTFHKGNPLLLVTFAEYVVGVKEGLYVPNPGPLFKRKEPDYERMMREEFCKEGARYFARLYLEEIRKMKEMSPENVLKSHFLLKAFYHFEKQMATAMRSAADFTK
jgi:hypothetical protein